MVAKEPGTFYEKPSNLFQAMKTLKRKSHALISLSLLLLLGFLFSSSASPTLALESWTGKVVAVKDGDTIEVLKEGKAVRIRLAEIDCPEKAQPFGNKAKQFTSDQCFGKTVKVLPQDIDRYGRTVAKIILPGGRSLNQELIKAGLAWQYTRYSHDEYLKHLEKEARKAKRGLWSDPHAIPPWEWRHAEQSKIQGANSSILNKQANPGEQVNKAQNAQIIYHGNIKSKVFHQPNCPQYDCKNCVREFKTREEAIQAGYKPCGICKP